MAALNPKSRISWDGKPFWGLTQQKGPWKTTSADVKRAHMKEYPSIGGGLPAGGTLHGGHGEWKRVLTPYDARTIRPGNPSDYAMRSIVTSPVDMKRQTKMGRAKKGLTLAGRTPLQSGEKMGLSTQTEMADQQVLPDLLTESLYGADEMSIEPSAPFVAEHQVAEAQDWITNTQIQELRTERPPPPRLSVSRRPSISVPPSRPTLSVAQGEMVSLAPSRSRLSVTRGETVALGLDHMEIDDVDNIIQSNVRVEEPPVTTFKPPALDLSLSETFIKSIADYEEGKSAKRKQAMKQIEKPVAVSTGEGKKRAMSATALAKIAATKGLTEKASSKLSKEKSTALLAAEEAKGNIIRIKPVKKKTVQKVLQKKTRQQPPTAKTVAALRKRLGDVKISSMFKAMKETNPQYTIFKAAHQKYMNEK